jgi:hypothetical protein
MATVQRRVGDTETIERLPTPGHSPAGNAELGETAGEIGSAALVAAFALLARRGMGPLAWTAFFRHDPIAFLLDTTSDAINLWRSSGELLYRNRAAERLKIGGPEESGREVWWPRGRRFERRCCRFRCGNEEYMVEVIGTGAESSDATRLAGIDALIGHRGETSGR